MRKIVLSVHGGDTAEGAAHVARLLRDQTGAVLEVVAVLEPLPIVDYGYGPVYIPDPEIEDALEAELRVEVERQLARCGLVDARLSVLRGPRVASIVTAAATRGADLVVVGIGPHHLTDRALGGETALQLAQQASTPVLAVPSAMRALPRRVLAAVDFSAASLGALRSVAGLLGGGEWVELVHVSQAARAGGIVFGPTHVNNAAHRLENFAAAIDLPSGTRAVNVFSGEPGRTLLEMASQTGAELIALGSHGYSSWQRLLMGSVSTKVLRLAHCAVLIYPARCVPADEKPRRSAQMKVTA